MAQEWLQTLKGGLGIAGKLVSQGIGEVQKNLKSEPKEPDFNTALYLCPGSITPPPKLQLLLSFSERSKRLEASGLWSSMTQGWFKKSFSKACQNLVYGRLSEAKRLFREILQDERSNKGPLADCYFLVGALELVQGNASEAFKLFETALLAQHSLGEAVSQSIPSFCLEIQVTPSNSFRFYPDFQGLNFLLSLSAYMAGNLPAGLQKLEQVYEVYGWSDMLAFWNGLMNIQNGTYEAAYKSLGNASPDSDLGVLNLALLIEVCLKLNDPLTAQEIVDELLKPNRHDFDPYLKLDLQWAKARAFMMDGYASQAKEIKETILGRFPNFTPLLERLSSPVAQTSVIAESEVQEPEAPTQKDGDSLHGSKEKNLSSAKQELEDSQASRSLVQTSQPPELFLKNIASERQFSLTSLPITIGREDCDILLEDSNQAASRKHAQIKMNQEGELSIEDLNSTNGTLVNGYKISKPCTINRGDLIQLGDDQFLVQ